VTSWDGPPGTMIELVPLPLFSIMPLTGEPGIMTDCAAPAPPVTRPGAGDVLTLDGPSRMPDDSDDDGGVGDCAHEEPAVRARHVSAANNTRIMAYPFDPHGFVFIWRP
jgi:hypothetical protein